MTARVAATAILIKRTQILAAKNSPMSLTTKAIFIVERNLARDLSLGWVAEQCGVTPFHLVRAFRDATGFSLMEYVRGRRLTKAAHDLALGADDILQIAIDHQYASHEAFSRAFKSRFSKTPEEVRRARATSGLRLVEPLSHLRGRVMKLKEPRIQTKGELRFVGLKRRVANSEVQNIAGQWQRFMSTCYAGIENRTAETVGITTAADDDAIDYVCAAEVAKFGAVPKGCIKLTVAPATYAIFAHDGHVTEIPQTYDAIWNEWFPKSGKTPAEAPGFERHNPTFDPRTGNGGVTIWLPIK